MYIEEKDRLSRERSFSSRAHARFTHDYTREYMERGMETHSVCVGKERNVTRVCARVLRSCL